MSKVSLHFLSTLVNCLRFQVCCTLDCSMFFLEGNTEVVLFHRFHGWEVSGEHFPTWLSPHFVCCLSSKTLLYWRIIFFPFLIFVTPVVAVILLDVLDALKHASEVDALLSLNSQCLCFRGAQYAGIMQ